MVVARPIFMVVTVSERRTARGAFKQIKQEKYSIGFKMTKATDKITYGMGATIPGIFGDYSALRVDVSVEFQGDASKFEEEIETYKERVTTNVARNLNAAAKHCGVALPFPGMVE